MELAGAVGALLGVDAVGRVEMHGVQPHARPVVVGRGFLDDHALVGAPLLEHEGAAGDDVPRLGPRRATPVGVANGGDGADVDRAPRRVEQDLEKIGRGVRQGDGECAGIAGHRADGGEVRGQPLVERLGAADEIEKIGVIGGERRGEDAAPGVHAVLRAEGRAIAPFGVGPEVKGVVETVGGNFPALGEGGHRGERAGFERHQRIKKRLDNLGVAEAGDGLRVKVGGLGADADMEHALTVGAGDGGLAPGATGAQPEGGGQKTE